MRKNPIILLTAIAVLLIFSNIANAAPKAQVDEFVYNAGELQQGKTIVHDFIVKNTGDRPLEIKVQPC